MRKKFVSNACYDVQMIYRPEFGIVKYISLRLATESLLLASLHVSWTKIEFISTGVGGTRLDWLGAVKVAY